MSAWTLDVLRAFRDTMNDAKASGTPDAAIGWPVGKFVTHGAYRPFVWFDNDDLAVADGQTSHGLVVVTGVVFAGTDPSVAESELEQGINAYYTMRSALATAADNAGSAFNGKFRGLAQPHPDAGGVKPSGADDFDGTCTLGERWLVQTANETPIPS